MSSKTFYAPECIGTQHNVGVPKNKLREVVARKLAQAIEAGETQASIASRSGISQQHISKLLKGHAAPTVDSLEGLARALRCQPWELLLDDEEARKAILERLLGKG